MDKRAIDKMYDSKRIYVEQILAAALKPMDRFGSIQYARDVVTGEEYIKITESDGWPWYINVTGNSLQAIGEEVCTMVGHGTPNGLVKVRAKQREINRMFTR